MFTHDDAHPVGNIANVFEQIDETAADIAHFSDDQQREADAHHEIGHGDLVLLPQPQGKQQCAYLECQRQQELEPEYFLIRPEPAP